MKKASAVILICAMLAAITTAVGGCAAAGYTVFDPTPCFSDDILFSAKIASGRANNAHDRMQNVIDEIDCEISLSKQNSGLSLFNAAKANERVEVGKHAYALFELSCEYYTLTSGAFNCASLPLSELWRVDSASLADLAPETDGTYVSADLPTPSQVSEVKALCDPFSITAEQKDGKYYLTKSFDGTMLDFGGIAKGYAVDKCVEILDEYDAASALIDISGNAYFYGDYTEGGKSSDWSVGVISPRPRSGQTLSRGYVAALCVEGNSSAVTSGDYMRYRIYDGDGGKVYVPHIICGDGVPLGVVYDGDKWVNSDEWVISATVIGKSSALCDALSTAVCALGFDAGGELLKKVGCKGLIFTEKEYTIIGETSLYKPDKYNGHSEYAYHEL